jgi:hypothetical protein
VTAVAVELVNNDDTLDAPAEPLPPVVELAGTDAVLSSSSPGSTFPMITAATTITNNANAS